MNRATLPHTDVSDISSPRRLMTVLAGAVLAVVVATGCGEEESPMAPELSTAVVGSGSATIEVITRTSGSFLEKTYKLTLDEETSGWAGANDRFVFQGVSPGTHSVRLTHVREGCDFGNGNPRWFTLSEGETASTTFDVTCGDGEATTGDDSSADDGSDDSGSNTSGDSGSDDTDDSGSNTSGDSGSDDTDDSGSNTSGDSGSDDTGNTGNTGNTGSSGSLSVPSSAAWVHQGTAIRPGGAGAWDKRLYGYGSPGPVFKKNGTYYMYYIGADGDRAHDGGPTNRSIGLATSSDGINWRKHPASPLITDQPTGDTEEGLWRLTGWMERNGTINLYATRLRSNAPNAVRGDIKLYTSSDGIRFSDRGVVIPHQAPGVPGSDEQAVSSVYHREADGTWFVFYSPKGESRKAAYCSGRSKTSLSNCGYVRNGENKLSAGNTAIPLSNSEVIIPSRRLGGGKQLYRVDPSNPTDWTSAGSPVSLRHGTGSFSLFLDVQAGQWFLYVAQGSDLSDSRSFDVYTAPLP